MVWSFVRTNSSDQGGSSANSFNVTVTSTTAGSLLVVNINIGDNAGSITSVTDNKSNTYSKAWGGVGPAGNGTLYQYYGVQAAGGNTQLTIALGTSTGLICIADEFTGGNLAQATVFDKASSQAIGGSNTSGTVPSFSPTANGELIAASALAPSATSAFVAGTNYTLGTNGIAFSIPMMSEYRLSSSGAETAPFSWTTASTYREGAGAYIVGTATNTGNFFPFFRP